jgi:hypothetical protein
MGEKKEGKRDLRIEFLFLSHSHDISIKEDVLFFPLVHLSKTASNVEPNRREGHFPHTFSSVYTEIVRSFGGNFQFHMIRLGYLVRFMTRVTLSYCPTGTSVFTVL